MIIVASGSGVIKQIYPKIEAEITVLENNIATTETEINNFRTTTLNMEWYGDAAEAVRPTIDAICADIVSLKDFIQRLKEEAGVSAQRTSEASQKNVRDINDIKPA